MEPSELGVDAVINLLMQKYSLLKHEVCLHIGYYKGHVAKFQLMGSALFAAGAYILSHTDLLPSAQNWWFWWVGATLVPVMAHYLIFDIIEAQYAMILLGERLATLEEEINGHAGRRILIWESFVSPLFWGVLRPMPGVINPDWFLTFFGLIIALFNALIVPVVLYWTLWKRIGSCALGMRIAVLLGGGFAILSMLLSIYCAWRVILGMRGKPRILFRQMIRREQVQFVYFNPDSMGAEGRPHPRD